MYDITDEQFELLTFIQENPRTLKEIMDFRIIARVMNHHTSLAIYEQLREGGYLQREKSDVNKITLSPFGDKSFKKYKKEKRLNKLERFPKIYWPIMNIIAWLFGILTAILIDRCKLSTQAQTKPTPIEQSSNITKKLLDSTLHK